jgi:hypothetical protein
MDFSIRLMNSTLIILNVIELESVGFLRRNGPTVLLLPTHIYDLTLNVVVVKQLALRELLINHLVNINYELRKAKFQRDAFIKRRPFTY